MEQKSNHLETLSEIRAMMERSTRFISLNGLSGVFAGLFAIIGAMAAVFYLKIDLSTFRYYDYSILEDGSINIAFYIFVFTDALVILVVSVVAAYLLSVRKARKKGLKLWDSTAKRLLVNMVLPLAIGGVFCLALVYHGLIGFVAPATLVFYRLALINASKYTLNDIRYLGICEAVTGLLATIWVGYGLLFWMLGFGLLHIVYGIAMYYKYER